MDGFSRVHRELSCFQYLHLQPNIYQGTHCKDQHNLLCSLASYGTQDKDIFIYQFNWGNCHKSYIQIDVAFKQLQYWLVEDFFPNAFFQLISQQLAIISNFEHNDIVYH